MNKKQIKQEKVLKKKAMYQVYWKTLFNQYRQANEKNKDGETNTNIVEIQLKGDNIQNEDLLEQGFEKEFVKQKNIHNFSEHENTNQRNKYIEQNTQFKDPITSLLNKETLISQQNQNDLKIQPMILIKEASNIISQSTKSTRFQENSKGTEQVKQCSKVQLKKGINSNLQKNQVQQKIQVNQVVQNMLFHNKQLTLQESFRKQNSNRVKIQSKKVILKKQQKSLKLYCKKIPQIELPKNEVKFTKSKDQIQSNLLKTQFSNIHQIDQTNKQLLTKKKIMIIPKVKQQEKNQDIEDNKQTKNCIETPSVNQPKVIVHEYQENELKELQINNLISSKTIQQSAAIADLENKFVVYKSGSQELQIQNDELNLENKNKQPKAHDKLCNSITTSTQNVVRNLNDRENIYNQLDQDYMQIQIDLNAIITEQSALIPNYKKFIECIQYLHNLEKAHLDNQKLATLLL